MSLRASGAVEKALIYPPAPQGGSCNIQYINKSPLGDLGVKKPGGTFSTAPWVVKQYFYDTFFLL